MKIPCRIFLTPLLLLAVLLNSPQVARAAAKQYVVVIAEGASPQLLELGKSYLRRADEDPGLATSFDQLIATGKAVAGESSLALGQGLLETASKSGYKTGLVTTGDVAAIAPLFWDLQADVAQKLTGESARYDFLAGGGRAGFGPDTGSQLRLRGNTYLNTAQSLDGEIQGRVLATQADADLAFAIDRDPTTEAGLAEMTTLALDVLGQGDTPFVLVIHDTLVKKALETKDTPALFEQFRELNALLANVAARRDENPSLGIALLLTGSPNTPRFTTQVETEQKNALFVISNLSLSYAGAGRALQRADNAALSAFTDPDNGQYKGLPLSPQAREAITAGALNPETAIRAALEPALQFGFDGPAAAPVAFTLGIDAAGGLISALQAIVAAPAK